jgi:putative ABC transport system ATP-binding protein
LPILSVNHVDLAAGARVAVTGPSGAGKSTLLSVLSGIVKPGSGRVAWGEADIAVLPERARDSWRRRTVGLVFQDFHLVPELDILANILLPATFTGTRIATPLRERAASLAAALRLADPRRRAGLLSRGEQQRTAIARALLHEPAIILADEPTASLDEETGADVTRLLVETARRHEATLIVATHDPVLISELDLHWRLGAGRLAVMT